MLLFLAEFLALGVIASLLGAGLGFAGQALLAQLVSALVDTTLPPPGWAPFFQGLAVSVLLLVGFLAPHLVRLARVPALAVLRREWAQTRTATFLTWGVGAVLLAALMLWVAGEVGLGARVVGGFAGAVAVFAALAWGLLHLVVLARHRGPIGFRFGLASVRSKLGLGVVQTVGLGIGLMAVILLSATRADLLANWSNSVPADAPNRFVINIQPEQRAPVASLLAGSGVSGVMMNPMVRGRLIAVNGQAVSPKEVDNDQAQRLLEREFNLSYDSALPYGNKVTAGQWHGAVRGEPQFSVEAGLAKTLGLKLGDVLRFDIAGRVSEARISSLRELRWDSMRVNFFVIAPPDTLQDFPASFITAFHLRPDQARVADDLVARFPNLTVIDASAVLSQFKQVMDQLARAVETVFVFSIVAGVVVLLAALSATHDERRFEVAVLRTLGAHRRVLRWALVAEFATLGGLAGLLGAIGAAGTGWVLAKFVFKLPYEPTIGSLATYVAASAVAVVVAGLLGTRSARNAPVLESMRSST